MHSRSSLLVVSVLFIAATAGRGADPKPTPEQAEFFEKKVRPVLVAKCFACHSADKKRSGGLLVDSRAALLKGGDTGPAIVPGDPDKSLLVVAIGYQDTPKMPKRSKLPDEEVADLTAWVKMGAPWPNSKTETVVAPKEFDLEERKKHWSLQPLARVAPPQVKNKDWPRNDMDRFILAALEAKGLQPADPADKRTWLRRVTFDLIGLPPTPAEIDAFLKDEASEAYEKVVDRLLASPRYGERWARHWLDLVRFAETSGHEFDFEIPHAFEYRDYVVRAFNADVPYDQFVREHLAGDLLPKPRRHPEEGFNESILGTGFWFLGESKHSPVDIRQDGADRRDNMIDVFSKTFLGLTVSCARCHDHKFDAITTKDYYSLVSYLQSSRCDNAFIDAPERIDIPARKMRQLRTEVNKLAAGQAAVVLSERLDKLSAALTDRNGEGHAAFRKALAAVDAKQTNQPFGLWRALTDGDGFDKAEVFAARRKALLEHLQSRLVDQSVVFEDFKHATEYKGWFTTGAAFGDGPSTAFDAVLQPDQPVPVKELIGRGVAHSGLVSNKLQGSLRSRTFQIDKKFIYYRVAGRGMKVNLIIDGFQQIRDPIYGGLTFHVNHGPTFAWHKQDVSMWVGLKAYIEVLDDGDGFAELERVVFSDGAAPQDLPNAFLLQLLEDPAVTSAETLARQYQTALTALVNEWRDGKLDAAADVEARIAVINALLSSNVLAALPSAAAEKAGRDRDKLTDLLKQIQEIEAKLLAPRRAMAMADGDGDNDYVYKRGNHKTPGEPAPRRFLEALAGADQPPPAKGSGRLELAERLLAESNPLPARVLANRLCEHHFGDGIVRSPDNFGLLGQMPTHPELLDWLAQELRRRHWSIKEMHRLLVLSSTYRMASRGDAKSDEADPENRLLHRLPLRRLEAEAVRDAMLAVSGRLDTRMYGPGPLPYLTPFMVGRGRPGASGPLDGDGRRSVYLNIRRNFLNPMFLAFDYPVPFTTIGKRSVSNVPAQALTLLNNPFVIQQAQLWSKQVLAEANRTTRERITGMYVTAFSRPPTAAELKDAQDFLTEQAKEYGQADDPRAWADLCHVLFNVKEFIFLN
jgi:hypothetical protein